jgi:hypothetical protein
VSIVVDGGAVVYGGASSYYPSQPAYATPVSNYQYSYVGSYQNINANTCQGSTAPTTAIAGQTYVYLAHACGAQGLGFTYTLAVAPNGANINAQTGLVTWNVPSNAVNQSYQFLILATNGYNATPMRESFSVYVTGGTPTINTVTTRPTTVVRYIETPTSYTTAPAYANQTVVSVNAGRVVPPTNYQYYGGSAYGAMLPAANVSISTFNIAVRATTNNEMAVSWDTNKPTSGEVVFGYSSQSRGPDLDRTILNYDFTTGEIGGSNTRHEASLGKLEASQ